MRILIAIGVLLLAGMVGVIVQHGATKPAARSGAVSDHAGAKIATISRGEAVELAGHVAGPRTVVEFTADW